MNYPNDIGCAFHQNADTCTPIYMTSCAIRRGNFILITVLLKSIILA